MVMEIVLCIIIENKLLMMMMKFLGSLKGLQIRTSAKNHHKVNFNENSNFALQYFFNQLYCETAKFSRNFSLKVLWNQKMKQKNFCVHPNAPPNNPNPRLWIEKTNVLVDNETDISGFRESLGAIEIANAVKKKSLAGIETAIRVFETQPRRERDLDR